MRGLCWSIALGATVLALAGSSLAAPGQAASARIDYVDPPAAITGTTIDVWGSGFTGAKAFEIGLLHVPFHVNGGGWATITIPDNAVTGQLGFFDSAGAGHSSSVIVHVIPHVTSFSPTHGTLSTLVTVHGSGFGSEFDHPEVTIGSDRASPHWPVSPNTIRLTPSSESGTIAVKLDGYTSASSYGTFTLDPSFNDPPFSRDTAERGDPVTIWGGGFHGASSVTFGAVPAGYTVDTNGRGIQTTVPAGALTGPVTVTTPNGKIVSRRFGVLPTIAVPASGPLGEGATGSTLVLTGQAFTGTKSVRIGGVAAPFRVTGDTSISATVPATATTNLVSVTNAGGTTSSSRSFVVDPTISRFAPAAAKAGGTVTLTGSGFGAAGETRQVQVGGVTAGSVTWRSPNEVRFVVPVGARTGKISIAVDSGKPAVSAASPTIAPNVLGYDLPTYRAGDPLTIQGNHLEGASAVSFGKVPAEGFTLAGDGDSITTSVPQGVLTGPVSVTTPGGIVTGPTIRVVPTIDALPSTEGPTGSVLALTGNTFTGTTRVTVGGAVAPFKVVSPTSLTVTVPSAAVSGKLAVTNAGGTTISADGYVVDPHIARFSPTTAGAGATVTLTGSGFGAAGETRNVAVGGVPASSTWWLSPTSVRFAVAPGTHTGAITINVSTGPVTAQSSGPLVVPPSISGYDQPTYRAGDPVTIRGSSLAGATALKFGSVVVTSGFTVDGDGDSIAATVPSNAVTAPVTVVGPPGSPKGPALHVVATIASMSPTDAAAGATITLTGNTFTGTTAVHFGAAAAPFHTVSATTLTAVVPPGAATGHVSVTNAGGTSSSTQTFAPHPRLSGLAPSSGATGDTVTIGGSGLDALTGVTFAGVSGRLPATVVSATPTVLRVVVPDGAVPGPVVAQSAVGTASSTTSYRVTFSVTGLQYTDAPSGTDEYLTGIGFTGANGVYMNGTYVGAPNFAWAVISDTLITFSVPVNPWWDIEGPVTVGKGTKSARLPQSFSWLRITGHSPAAPAVGATLTLHGGGFLRAHDVGFPVNSKWQHVTSFTVNGGGTTISAQVPDGFQGGYVGVFLDNGLIDTTDIDAESIWSVSPASGSVGDTVTISGSGLSGNKTVAFNGTPATTQTIKSVNEITAVVPVGATTGRVTVTDHDGGGTAISPGDFTVTG